MAATLVHIVAANSPIPVYGIFTDRAGKLELRLVACWGTMQVVQGEKETRLVAGFCVDDHLEAADFKPDFVGYTTDSFEAVAASDRWQDKKAAVIKRWKEIDEAKAKQKIVIPNQGVVNPFSPN